METRAALVRGLGREPQPHAPRCDLGEVLHRRDPIVAVGGHREDRSIEIEQFDDRPVREIRDGEAGHLVES